MNHSIARIAVATFATALVISIAQPQSAARAESEPTCSETLRDGIPPPFDPATCWRAIGSDPELVDGIVFVWREASEGDGAQVVGLDATTGEQVWASSVVDGDVRGIEPATVDGTPGIAVLVLQTTEGDAVTESTESWTYIAWSIAAKSDAPTRTISMPATHESEPVWSAGHLAVDGQVLLPGTDAFQPYSVGDEVAVGQYDMSESFVGFAGSLSASFVEDLAWTEDGSEDGESYAGWVVRGVDGTVAWQDLTSAPNANEYAIGYDGPRKLPVVVGELLLTVTGEPEGFASPSVAWIDATTGEPATAPTPDQVAGQPISTRDGLTALATPSGTHVYISSTADPFGVVVDVAAGTVRSVATDFTVEATAIDDTTVYGTTSQGNATVDLATAEAAALPAGTQPPIAADANVAVFAAEYSEEFAVALRGG